MRDAFYRLTSPILDRIPDITHQPKSRQVSIGFAASLLFHLLLLLLALLFGMILPEHGLLHFAKPKPKLEEIEITVLPVAPELQISPAEQLQPFIDSAGLALADRPVNQPLFQSDAEMRAASSLPVRGLEPLPTQDGINLPDVAIFGGKPLSLDGGAPPAPADRAAERETPAAEKMPPSTAIPETTKPTENDLVLPKIVEPPPAPAPEQSLPKMRTSASSRDISLPSVAPRTANDEPKTRTDGNIIDDGPDSVNATVTPYAKYLANVRRAIKSRWNFYLEAKAGLTAPGSVRVDFSIDRDGRISNVRSAENTANATYAAICENAVRESQLPPLPQAVLDTLLDDRLDLTFRFHHIGRSQF